MELQDFIANSIVGVVNGMQEAQAKVAQHNAIVSPRNITTDTRNPEAIFGRINRQRTKADQEDIWRPVQLIEFDVAVTAGTSVEGEGGVNISVAKMGGAATTTKENLSRISFAIPVAFPENELAEE